MIERLQERIRQAAADKTPLRIRGGGTKDFYGGPLRGEVLDMRECRGVVSYEPTELVITVRAGTPLAEVDAVLEEKGQFLAFEPPHFGAGATVGGCVAAGLSGPRRAAAGAVRDFVLGVHVIDGRGELLAFGGQVMKNVAGYDVSRFLAGSLGTLGLLVDVSLKVLPRPVAEATLRLEMDQAQAIAAMNAWGGQPLPVSATCHRDGELLVRLSGAQAAVSTACRRLGGEPVDEGAALWTDVREQRSRFFAGSEPLWRLSLPSTTPPLALPGRQLIEWGGALRWLKSDAPAAAIRAAAEQAGGHATLFRGGDRAAGVFHPLSPALLALHRNLKRAFDPEGIFNPGRLYPEL
ncbi:MAG: glycolate oxidase subunit GlcE [Pseudomonadota bacterium]|jgi:glycolate oxidase FAD binding subunit